MCPWTQPIRIHPSPRAFQFVHFFAGSLIQRSPAGTFTSPRLRPKTLPAALQLIPPQIPLDLFWRTSGPSSCRCTCRASSPSRGCCRRCPGLGGYMVDGEQVAVLVWRAVGVTFASFLALSCRLSHFSLDPFGLVTFSFHLEFKSNSFEWTYGQPPILPSTPTILMDF